MKYLVLIAVVVLVVLYWRSRSRPDGSSPSAPPQGRPATPALPEDMVRCQVCALHLPRAEATTGPQGQLYCSQDHLLADARGDDR
ncbi:MAG: hypothetical protein EOO25_16935 [Comamonadaceae bacterium]|nr:MAG: hypothetical protein EOO25_16935 [Comamonadaceae bacterium]